MDIMIIIESSKKQDDSHTIQSFHSLRAEIPLFLFKECFSMGEVHRTLQKEWDDSTLLLLPNCY